jgi:anaerobic magnesium-protoporphyrin IX monomethyl ester cyclase
VPNALKQLQTDIMERAELGEFYIMKRSQNRILLVEPPFYRLFKSTYSLDRYPLSLGYLSGAIRKDTNWDVVAYNSDFTPQSETMRVNYLTNIGFHNYLNNLKDLSGVIWNEVKSTISEYKPTVIGISAKSQNLTAACIVARLAKEVDGKIIVIVGGPHPTMVGSEVLNSPYIDIAVKGEGEETIVEILDSIEGGRDFNTIKGIVYRKDGLIFENAPREFIEDLDSVCFPYEYAPEVLKDYHKYPVTAFKNIFAIRGCPYSCLFCGSHKIWSRKVRFRSPDNVIREIKGLQDIGLKSVHFADDTFGVNKKYINDLCNALIRDCPKVKWSCELHVKLVDEQTISLMKQAGCYSISIGIESGNNEILKQMRKNITIEQALFACKIIKKHGIELHAFFMVGFPQETEASLNATVVAMGKIKPDELIYSIFTPYPGTEGFEACKERGLISKDYDVSLHNHMSPANCFCANIPPERFRVLVSKIEKMVDRKNWLSKLRRISSSSSFMKMRELGLAKGFQKGMRVLVGK